MDDRPGRDDDLLPEDREEMLLGAVSFAGLSATDFEEFCFDLMSEAGFVNVDWRKGTPKGSSPSDRGRDIVAQLERRDVDDHQYLETWFVDCKHYTRGVPRTRRTSGTCEGWAPAPLQVTWNGWVAISTTLWSKSANHSRSSSSRLS